MRYYVVSDIHGYYTELINILNKKGFFDDTLPKKLIVCGDLFDRGNEAKKLEEFLYELYEKNELILIKGNHEDLMEEILYGWYKGQYMQSHHKSNGTIGTISQLVEVDELEIIRSGDIDIRNRMLNTKFIKYLMPSMLNYFETKNYIFVHGYIPCEQSRLYGGRILYEKINNFRNCSDEEWMYSRWINGMDAYNYGIKEDGKTIVCGHWHCSWGHAYIEKTCTEFPNKKSKAFVTAFEPFVAKGIIAIDACTAYSGKINCIVLNDEEN